MFHNVSTSDNTVVYRNGKEWSIYAAFRNFVSPMQGDLIYFMSRDLFVFGSMWFISTARLPTVHLFLTPRDSPKL